MDEISVHVEAEINPTESEQKVKQAVGKVFGDIPMQVESLHKKNMLVAEAKGQEALTNLHHLLRRERIRSAARQVLFEGIDRKTISFCLNKQVAYVGHISFSKETAESPLGPIRVKITCEDPRRLIEWLAPRIA